VATARRTVSWARAALHGSAALLFAVMVGLVLAQVVARKFFEPLVWSEELARYLFIWVAFLGWIIATERRSHIAIAQGVERAGPRLAGALGWFNDLATLALMALLLRWGAQLVLNNRDIEAVSLPIPFSVVYAAVPIAALAITVVLIVRRVTGRSAA
jgi:TRAP-type C4-dicarboxylate transport system permease small subunit